jgi:hypothetical protein
MAQSVLRLTLVGRSYCSLCDKLRDALTESAARLGILIALDEIDIDQHPSSSQLEARFGEWVPVLLVGSADAVVGALPEAVEICHYHFDEAAFQTHAGSVSV